MLRLLARFGTLVRFSLLLRLNLRFSGHRSFRAQSPISVGNKAVRVNTGSRGGAGCSSGMQQSKARRPALLDFQVQAVRQIQAAHRSQTDALQVQNARRLQPAIARATGVCQGNRGLSGQHSFEGGGMARTLQQMMPKGVKFLCSLIYNDCILFLSSSLPFPLFGGWSLFLSPRDISRGRKSVLHGRIVRQERCERRAIRQIRHHRKRVAASHPLPEKQISVWGEAAT